MQKKQWYVAHVLCIAFTFFFIEKNEDRGGGQEGGSRQPRSQGFSPGNEVGVQVLSTPLANIKFKSECCETCMHLNILMCTFSNFIYTHMTELQLQRFFLMFTRSPSLKERATTPYSCHGIFTESDRSIFSLNLPCIQTPTGTSVTNHKQGHK